MPDVVRSYRMEELAAAPSAQQSTERGQVVQFAYTMQASGDLGEVRLYGYISRYKGWDGENATAKQFAADLKALGKVKTLNVYINSPGGDVFEGMAMRSELMLYKAAQKNVIITSLCASAATLISSLPKKAGVRVKIMDGAMMMIHNPSAMCWGNAADMDKMASTLHTLEENFADVYQSRCGKDTKAIRDLMDAETWYTAQKAVDNGFADEVIDEADADADTTASAEKLPSMTAELWAALGYRNVPETLLAAMSQSAAQEPPAQREPVSNAAPAATEHNDSGTKGRNTMLMTMEQLTQEHPQLCEQLRTEGATKERARLQAIDNVYAPDNAKLVADAKYGEKPMTAEELCMKLNAAARESAQAKGAQQQQAGAAYMAARTEESADMKNIGADDGAAPAANATALVSAAQQNTMAKAIADAANAELKKP